MKGSRTWFPWEPPSGSLGSTSPSLVLGYRSGDANSWKRLEDIYGPVVYHIFLSQVAMQDRDDVFQEVFITAWRSRERFEKTPGRPSFRAWLSRISENTVRNYERGKKRHQRAAPIGGCEHHEMMEQITVHDPSIETADESGSGANSAENMWNACLDVDQDILVEGVRHGKHIRILVRRRVLEMVLEEIEEIENQSRTRELALRQIIKGESAEAAARAMGARVSAAYTAKCRVLKRARAILEELGEPVDDGEGSLDQSDGVEP